MKDRIKVLYFIDNLEQGGIQQLIFEIAKNINRKNIKIDILVFNDSKEYPMEVKLKKMNYNIFKVDGWIYKVTDYIKQARELNKFFEEHNKYDIIHLHSSSKNYQVLKYAKKYNIPIRISHSHSTAFQTQNKAKIIIGNILKYKLKKYTTHYFACSKDAAIWLFGKDVLDENKVTIIPNAIDIKKFKYDSVKRNEMRKLLNISAEEILIGNVGRFVEPKNHVFLIDVFNEVHKEDSRYKLLLIGTGKQENIIKEKVKQLGLNNKVIFVGYQPNVNDYLQAMDLFILPSKFEGLGIVLIEAQANGLNCIVARDNIPKEANLTNMIKYISLDDGVNNWKNEILRADIQRYNSADKIKQKGYSIENLVSELEKIYMNI